MGDLKPSVPEPAPVNRGQVVADSLLDMLHGCQQPFAGKAAELVRQRDAYGRSKYGQPLMTDDGRNTLEDLRQELGDALMYAHKARMTGAHIDKASEWSDIKRFAQLVVVILEGME